MVKFRENLIFAYSVIPLFRIPRFTNSQLLTETTLIFCLYTIHNMMILTTHVIHCSRLMYTNSTHGILEHFWYHVYCILTICTLLALDICFTHVHNSLVACMRTIFVSWATHKTKKHKDRYLITAQQYTEVSIYTALGTTFSTMHIRCEVYAAVLGIAMVLIITFS